jgi:hypothetical protein
MASTWVTENTTLATRCQGSWRRQVSQCSGKRRVKATTAGTSASSTRLLLNSQTTGSQGAVGRPRRRMSMLTVRLLLTAWIKAHADPEADLQGAAARSAPAARPAMASTG